MNNKLTRFRLWRLGQGLVEFAIALPILLFLLFGIIEFGRILQSWMTVQNSARFGLRYIVTGEFDQSYCNHATAALGLGSADTHDGDPANDCNVPDSYGSDARELTDQLVDWARLPSTLDVALVGATGINIDSSPSVFGNYISYLSSHNLNDLGSPTANNYYHVTICSSRDSDPSQAGSDFYWDDTTNPLTCYDAVDNYHMDDPGGPGDRVRIFVTYNHELILPFLRYMWPQVTLSTWREGIVERFRTSRISGIGGQISDPPTETPTITPTSTSTITLTPTNTSTPTETFTPTPTPDCSLYTFNDFAFSNGSSNPSYAQFHIDLSNAASGPVNVERIVVNWDYAEAVGVLLGYDWLRTDWIKWNGSRVWGGSSEGGSPNDYASTTDTAIDSPWSWTGPLVLSAGNSGRIQTDLDSNWSTFETDGLVIPTDFGITAYLDNECIIQRPPIERPLPSPDCSLYSMTDFTFTSWGHLEAYVTNGDIIDANLSRISLNWGYLEGLFELINDTSLGVDYFSFDSTYVWGEYNQDVWDYDSPTDSQVDSPNTWVSTGLDAGETDRLIVDFDKNNERPAEWLQQLALLSSDFGITIEFDNGCTIERTPVTRPYATQTPDCSLLYSDHSRISGDDFEIRIVNENFVSAYLVDSTHTWPTHWNPNMYFNYFQFLGNRYYDPAPLYTSPVSSTAPNVELPGYYRRYWESDFNNWPSDITAGGFTGDLSFELGTLICPIYGEVFITPTPTTPPPTSTSQPTDTVPPTDTNTPGPTSTSTSTPTMTLSPTVTTTSTRTLTPTFTLTPTLTRTPTNTSPPTATSDATDTPVPTDTPTEIPTETPTPCLTPPDLGGC